MRQKRRMHASKRYAGRFTKVKNLLAKRCLERSSRMGARTDVIVQSKITDLRTIVYHQQDTETLASDP